MIQAQAAQGVIDQAKAASLRLVTVESCTGGLIANLLTDVPGASAVYWGGWVTYDEAAKEKLVGAPREVLASKGTVSSETAVAMAEGGARIAGARSLAISITGIAGPSGGSAEKPVGLAYVGWALNEGNGMRSGSRELREDSTLGRDELKRRFARSALELALERLRASAR